MRLQRCKRRSRNTRAGRAFGQGGGDYSFVGAEADRRAKASLRGHAKNALPRACFDKMPQGMLYLQYTGVDVWNSTACDLAAGIVLLDSVCSAERRAGVGEQSAQPRLCAVYWGQSG